MRKLWTVLIVLLAMCLVGACVLAGVAGAGEEGPAIEQDTVNKTAGSPLNGTVYFVPSEDVTVWSEVTCTGFEPGSYSFKPCYSFYLGGAFLTQVEGDVSQVMIGDDGVGSLEERSTLSGSYTDGADTIAVSYELVNKEAGIPFISLTFEVLHAVQKPSLPPNITSTNATNEADGSKTVGQSTSTSVVDVVSYVGLYTQGYYYLETQVVVKSTSETLVTSSIPLAPSESGEGSITAVCNVDTSALGDGEQIVVFQRILTTDNTPVAVHQDLNDADQTLTVAAEPTVDVTATKVWLEADGATEAEPPEGATVSLQLRADGADVGEPVVVSAQTGWAATWTDLPKVSSMSGRDIAYTVAEVAFSAPDFELAGVTGDMQVGYTVVNKRRASPIPDTGDATRPGLTVGLGVAGAAVAVAGVAFLMRRNRGVA